MFIQKFYQKHLFEKTENREEEEIDVMQWGRRWEFI